MDREKYRRQAEELVAKLSAHGFRATADGRSEKIGYKIREAQLEKVPYMVILGDKEAENGTLSIRSRAGGDLGSMTVEDFLALCHKMVAERILEG